MSFQMVNNSKFLPKRPLQKGRLKGRSSLQCEKSIGAEKIKKKKTTQNHYSERKRVSTMPYMHIIIISEISAIWDDYLRPIGTSPHPMRGPSLIKCYLQRRSNI